MPKRLVALKRNDLIVVKGGIPGKVPPFTPIFPALDPRCPRDQQLRLARGGGFAQVAPQQLTP